MVATIQRGYTFGATELVTNTKLHTLVDSATISGFDVTNLASGSGLVIRSTSTPSNTDSIWVDTNMTPPVVKIYSGSEWQGTGSYGVFTNKSGTTRSAGDVVVVDTANAGAYTTTTDQGNQRVLGVVMQSTLDSADGVVALPGARVQLLSVNGTTAIGDFLATSTTAAQAVPSATYQLGTFAIAMALRTGAGTITEAVLLGLGGFAPTAANALAGSVVQVVNTQTAAYATGTTVIPYDNTQASSAIPLITEGDQYLSLAITPTNASNLLDIHVLLNLASIGNAYPLAALFQDAGAAAIATGWDGESAANTPKQIVFKYRMTAGTTSSTTFTVRAGTSAGGVYLNGDSSGNNYFFGTLFSSMTITEIKV